MSGLLRAPSALLRLLRRDAHWRQTSVTAAVGSGIGLVNDVFSPIAQFYALLFGVAATTFAFSYLRWRQQRRSGVASPRLQKRRAKMAMASLVFGASILPFWILNGATRSEGGTVATLVPQVQEAQQSILGELRILGEAMEEIREGQEEQTQILQDSAAEQQRQGETLDTLAASTERQEESLGDIRDSSRRQEESLSDIEVLMSASVALERLAQASADRDGTDIGQAEAVEALLARGRRLEGRDFSGISLRRLNASEIDLTDSPLHFTDFREATLSGATFTGAGLKFTNLGDAELDRANLAGTESHFLIAPGVNLQDADLSGGQFIGADFTGANLAGANLQNARFLLTDFEGANLENANLTGAVFVLSRLTGASLSGAELSQTMLETSFVDEDALTRRQKAGTCRHPINEVSISTYERISERFDDPSDSDGYSISRFSPDAYYRSGERPQYSVLGWPDWAPNLLKSTDPLCETTPDSGGIVSVSAPLRFTLRLDRSYLGQRDRRSFVKRYYTEQYRRLLIPRDNDRFFVGSMAPQDRWIDQYKRALRSDKPERGAAFSFDRQADVLAAFLREDAYEPSALGLARLAGNDLKTAAEGSELASLRVEPGRGEYSGIGGYSDEFPFYEAPPEAGAAYLAHVVKTAPRMDEVRVNLDFSFRKRRSYERDPETQRSQEVWTLQIENQTVRAPTLPNGRSAPSRVMFYDGPSRQPGRGDRVGPLLKPFDELPENVIEAMEGRGILLSWVNTRAGSNPGLFIVLDDWRGDEILTPNAGLTSDEVQALADLSVSLAYKIGRTIHRDQEKGILVVQGRLTDGVINSTPPGLFD
ncbi:MAG: pentapeptide repeat-containing protein [Pseudomonadota bacterium]